MSKGNRIVKARMSEELIADVEKQLKQRNEYTRGEPWTLSDFVRAAVAEKLAKMERSRRSKPAKRVPLGDEVVPLAKGGAA